MSLADLSAWFSTGMVHDWVIGQAWVFPSMETAHFIGLSLLFGALLIVDGRVLGLCKFVNMAESMKFIPVAIIGFAINLISGYVFLSSDPDSYLYNLGFQWKMILIAIAGVNALWFWLGEHEELKKLADGADAPFRAKVIALASLVLWVGVIILGRMIPYADNI